MQFRELGTSSLITSWLGLGTATFGREIDEAESFALLDHALSQGITLIDTAENYGGGQARRAREKAQGFADIREVSGEFHSSELIIGRWLRSRKCRDKIILQTKVLPPLTKSRIVQAIDDSLKRLQTSFVDVYLAHAFDPATSLEETLEAFASLRSAGKVRCVGASNFSAEQLQQAIDLRAISHLSVVQSNYNLAMRDIETDLIPLCRSNRIGVQTYSPLGAGFLTGKYTGSRDALPQGSRFHVSPAHADIYFQKEKFRIVRNLQCEAERLSVPVAQLAVAWVLANPAVDCVLIGARNKDQIDSALQAMQTPLTQTARQRLGG